MYYANFISSPEGYFHTVICNGKEFRNTTVNHDLHFVSWDNPPKQHPHYLSINDMSHIVDSNAPFARKFRRDHPILDKIDAELLFRRPNMIVPGGWCVGSRKNGSDPCLVVAIECSSEPHVGSLVGIRRFTLLLSDHEQLSSDAKPGGPTRYIIGVEKEEQAKQEYKKEMRMRSGRSMRAFLVGLLCLGLFISVSAVGRGANATPPPPIPVTAAVVASSRGMDYLPWKDEE
ncbi:hypothetical protein B296_00050935 [Ensete ventricosum]|uniref:Uncharacterized protein n=1 Tax=Ensete ventricosum TaxID=4639 RepID=A0A426XWL3_ENSVE|nr:hypothetical protein B296_00050935 [Ensete ventricosum]